MVLDPGPNGIKTPNIAERAGATTRLDVNAFTAPAQGTAAIGEGIQKIGGAMAELFEKKRVADDVNAEHAFALMTEKANNEIAAAVASEPDETKHADIATSRMAQLESDVAEMNLPPATKKSIDFKFQMNQERVAGGIKLNAARQSIGRAQTNIQDIVNRAAFTQDDALAESTLTNAVDAGLITPVQKDNAMSGYYKQVEVYKKQEEARAMDAHKVNVAAQANAVPLKDVEKHIDSLGIPADQKVSLKNYAQAVNHDGVTRMAGSIADGMATGEIWNEYELDATYGHSPFMTPGIRESFKENIQKADILKQRMAKQGAQGVENFVRTYTAALNWSPDKSEESQRDFSNRIADAKLTVPDDLVGEVTALLHAKFGAEPPKDGSKRTKVQSAVSKTIAEKFQARLKPLEQAVARVPKEKDPQTREWRTRSVDDPQYKAANDALEKRNLENIKQQTQLELQMQPWYDAHKDDDLEGALDHLNTLLTEPDRVSDYDMLRAKAGMQGDVGAAGAEGVTGELSDSLINNVKDFEGFTPNAEDDYKQTSIGYGTRAKYAGETITKEDADKRLREELGSHAGRIDDAVNKQGWKLTKGQRDWLVSFDFNTGRGAEIVATSKSFDEAKDRMKQYNKVTVKGEKVESPGLVNRRRREAESFNY